MTHISCSVTPLGNFNWTQCTRLFYTVAFIYFSLSINCRRIVSISQSVHWSSGRNKLEQMVNSIWRGRWNVLAINVNSGLLQARWLYMGVRLETDWHIEDLNIGLTVHDWYISCKITWRSEIISEHCFGNGTISQQGITWVHMTQIYSIIWLH